MGVTFFSTKSPENFDTFCRAFVSMFRITIGRCAHTCISIHQNQRCIVRRMVFSCSAIYAKHLTTWLCAFAILAENLGTGFEEFKPST